MADYILVHGARNDGSVWDEVVSLLQERGQRAFAPTLSGPEDVDLDDNISEVCDIITRENLDKVVLVGHSYAAMVITGVVDRMPERIKNLVFIDSAVPASGKSLFDMIESYGVSTAEYGLEPERPFTEPLYFDEERMRRIPKTYIHCTESEFLEAGKAAFRHVVEHTERDRWDFFELETDHHCMVSEPRKVAEILLWEGA
jgi:pimeloyl-ACP methyl ester carboxylesterase